MEFGLGTYCLPSAGTDGVGPAGIEIPDLTNEEALTEAALVVVGVLEVLLELAKGVVASMFGVEELELLGIGKGAPLLG